MENDLRRWMRLVESGNHEAAAKEPTNFRDLMKPHNSDQPVTVGTLFHTTPENRLASIMTSGLEPRAENLQDNFLPRVYLATTEYDAIRIAFQLRKAIVLHKGQKKSWREGYAVLKIMPPPDHTFYRDGYFVGGVYTDETIPPSAISLIGIIDGQALLTKNWREFWNWYTNHGGEYPATVPRWPSNRRLNVNDL
jgi:hypothetical protein